MDIMLAHQLIKLNNYMLCLSIIFSVCRSYSSFYSLLMLMSQIISTSARHYLISLN